MEAGMICLERGSTRLRMMDPRVAEPYYRGTRFDRTGIILSLESGGHRYIQPWQRHYDPFSHDAVSGPAEEFFLYGPMGPGFVKIGVGLLRGDGEPYDRFKLYEVLDPGRFTVNRPPTGGAGAASGVTQPQRSEDGRSRYRSSSRLQKTTTLGAGVSAGQGRPSRG